MNGYKIHAYLLETSCDKSSGVAEVTILTSRLSLGQGPCKVVVKDTIDIAGFPTCAGSAALADAPPAAAHAEVVERTLKAGYHIVGKANLHELAFGMTGINAWAGTPENPRYPNLIPGGSSSGSAAAVAAGLADIGIGTDTGGSIRVPAACCGVYGLKPTFGRLSRRGVMPAESSLDCVGPLACDFQKLMAFMAAIDPGFQLPKDTPRPVMGCIGVNADSAIWASIEGQLSRSGMARGDVALPLMAEAFEAAMVIINRETFRACEALLATGKVGADVEQRLKAAAVTTDAEIKESERVRRAFTSEVDALLENHDVLVLPTLPHFPMTVQDALSGHQDLKISSLARPFNLSGHPALSIPLESQQTLPVSVQLIGRHGDDAGVCRMASQLIGQVKSAGEEQQTGAKHATAH
ncbi:amidase [Halomonas sp. LC1]|uniref:amidase n=1 Tax=Halomonas sp. LC1 TaxID=3043733 RepID=UPI0025561CC8|nr:amidase [Halomonas sp. LC1]MDK9688329.1 amidase [Halomonas sp. LC1]